MYRVFRARWQSLVHNSLKNLQKDSEKVYENCDEPQQTNTQFCDIKSVDLPLQENCNPKEKWKNYNGNFSSYHTNPSKALGIIGCGTIVILGLHFNQQYLKYHDTFSKQSLLKYLTFVFPFNQAAIFDSTQKRSVVNSTEEDDVDLKHKQDLENATQEIKDLTENMLIGVDKYLNGVKAASMGDYSKAINYWKQSAELGYSKSSFNLGLCYDQGTGVERNIKKAVKYYTDAADQDHCGALFNLAVLHLHGKVANKSQGKSEAIKLLLKAANLGYPLAKTYLGVHYIEETSDFSQAVQLFTEAAKQKEPDAKYYLGLCYLKGLGIEQCPNKASNLFAEAAKLGHRKAKAMISDESLSEDSESETEYSDDDDSIEILTSSSINSTSSETENPFFSELWNRSLSIANQSMSLSETSSSSSSSFQKNTAKTEESPLMNSNNESLEEKFDSYLRHAPHCCNSVSIYKPNAASFSDFVLCS
ncbi:uncharacterized protein LOC106875932 isoform X2 [Octopus bimaculoides]|uniref:Uncharacterized protein n=1 Tax=Octopus bimaculoides TaxID=37653 RepID=A0A0L8IBC9_OCTBM|nr:uncharacterized protein LOC106875932 isoform X2 [Octopus bimaculoides]|eukprot:XP_014779745.1 PREDICTED: uncharacterized protein LOC106875932 isoform X2 [Octopus bimaculoides]